MKRKGPKYDKIIDAAVSVIAVHGYHQSQVSKIAKQASVADGTIYLYFKNKEDLLVSVFNEKMGTFIERTGNELKSKGSAIEKLLTLIEMHFCLLDADHQLSIVTQLELRQTNRALRAKIGEVLKRYLSLIDLILKEGMEERAFDKNMDTRLARQMIFGTIDETATNWVMNDHRYDLPSLAQPVHRMLVNGLSNNAGAIPAQE
ncbi:MULTISPECIES: TetR/AcrR family transcriptional regulator [unclassified Fictibacillus]|uniref:TetR/AcrR family transcriptional regulator n=1 Tax=unclassified Fictibacillus TaxID=2644029 RepID=UPI0006A7777F|nr:MULTISPECIES: TetR/AcrR family transcriptional regulator [unclassified Fictibacillus]MED2971560.1 TetR/AcrR family transcriptional regulator [Fictibacillus sp. B-59209]UZJ80357.1 TetR family transcriptional regulator [Fictibacillus sp. KU28468]SFD60416.1 transcriptional regulator, TetR family [Bacillus sp. OV194]